MSRTSVVALLALGFLLAEGSLFDDRPGYERQLFGFPRTTTVTVTTKTFTITCSVSKAACANGQVPFPNGYKRSADGDIEPTQIVQSVLPTASPEADKFMENPRITRQHYVPGLPYQWVPAFDSHIFSSKFEGEPYPSYKDPYVGTYQRYQFVAPRLFFGIITFSATDYTTSVRTLTPDCFKAGFPFYQCPV